MPVYCIDARLKIHLNSDRFKMLLNKIADKGYDAFGFKTWKETCLIINLELPFKLTSEILRPTYREQTLLLLYPVNTMLKQTLEKPETASELGITCISYSKDICLGEIERLVRLIAQLIGIAEFDSIFIQGNINDATKIDCLDELISKDGKLSSVYLTHERDDIKKITQFMVDKETRNILKNIKSKNFLRSLELNNDLNRRISNLCYNQLLNKEYAVFCGRCKRHIFTVRTKERIDETLSGKRCSCGANLDSKKIIEDVYRVTESVADALTQGVWLVSKVKDILLSLGVNESFIRVGIEINGNEIDLAFAHLGQLRDKRLRDEAFGKFA